MPTRMFVNLPVSDLEKSKAFFRTIGYETNPQFSDDTAACLVIEHPNLYAMLVTGPLFKTFTASEICDTSKCSEAIISLSAENRETVDALVEKAISAGATTPVPAQDHGFMYERSFRDLDGHMWSFFWMDEAAEQ